LKRKNAMRRIFWVDFLQYSSDFSWPLSISYRFRFELFGLICATLSQRNILRPMFG
jgi:hypothetical protein